MRKGADVRIVILLILGACSPEITAPEGGAAVGKVVPIVVPLVVPDVWCAADAGQDTTAAKRKNPPLEACPAPALPASGRDSLMFVVDSL
jgi:hypothetical protein